MPPIKGPMTSLLWFHYFLLRRSPRNVQTSLNTHPQHKQHKAFVAPTNVTIKEANFKFLSQATVKPSSSIRNPQETSNKNKPFKFNAKDVIISTKHENNILSNITNSSSVSIHSPSRNNFDLKASLSKPLSYKPHKGKLGEWNPRKTLEQRKALSNKMACKTKKGDIIRGVRLNKRTELLMKKRGLKGEN